MAFCKKNDIISIKEKSNDYTTKLGALATSSFQTLLKLIDVDAKKGRG